MVAAALSLVLALASDPVLDRLESSSTAPFRLDAPGFVTDSGHPMHPGDFSRYDAKFRFRVNPRNGEAIIECETGAANEKDVDRYFYRRGRIFQVDDKGEEVRPNRLGDLRPATVAALHPALVGIALSERRDAAQRVRGGRWLFAWNDELWAVRLDERIARVTSLERRVYHDVYGDGIEKIQFDGWRRDEQGGTTIVTLRGREIARIEFAAGVLDSMPVLPSGDRENDRAWTIGESEISIKERATGLFTLDLASINTRITIAEFADFLVVIEGAFNSRNVDKVVAYVRDHFDKPVRYFAFSHVHGQYIGGARSWIHAGATILVPPTTAPLIEEMARASHNLRPDVFSAEPRPVRLEMVKDRRHIEDGGNVLDIYNVVSEHTDEYFIFHFPKQKILLTGDLLFYRPEKPLTGRSQRLCATIRTLGIEVDECWATWPLDGYGTKNIVSGAELRAACDAVR